MIAAADLGWIKVLTLLSTPKPRRLMAPSLRSGSAGLNWMPPLFNTPREAVTITASPAVHVHMMMHHALKHKQQAGLQARLHWMLHLSKWAHQNWMLLQEVHKNSRQSLQARTSRRLAQGIKISACQCAGAHVCINYSCSLSGKYCTCNDGVACCDLHTRLIILDLLYDMVVQNGQSLCQSLDQPQIAPCMCQSAAHTCGTLLMPVCCSHMALPYNQARLQLTLFSFALA